MSDTPIRVLLIEEVAKHARLLREMLDNPAHPPFVFDWADSLRAGLDRLAKGDIDVILLDLVLPDARGLESVDRARAAAPRVPIIVLSSIDDETLAVQAVHEGAQDYLVDGRIDQHLLVRSIRYAIERKRAEVELLQTQEKYRSIFENTVEGIFQTTPDGHYLSANRALARIYGYETADELIESLTNIASQLYVQTERREEFVRLMQENQVVRNFESQVYRRDGTVIWISENVRAVRDAWGRLGYYEGTVEDITDRKMAEGRLRDSETLYHSLVETLPQNIFRKDLSERFTFANQRFCQTLGKSLDEILGKTDFDFFPPELAAKYQQDDRLIMETGRTFETIEEHQPPGGGKIYVNVVKTPLYGSSGKIIGLQGIFWDITEKRLAEERLNRANGELAESREELRVRNQQMEEDLKMAREFQQAILPQQYPVFPAAADPQESRLRFCHRYFPSGAVGGDFFNVLTLSDTKAGVFICDVMGHGVRSALVTSIMRALVQELTPFASEPGQLLRHINRDLRAILKQTGTPMFTTAFYMVLDTDANELSFANAGHPRPFLIHRHTQIIEQLCNCGGKAHPALGIFDQPAYPTSKVALVPGDVVMLFTDGLYDVDGPIDLGPEWVLDEVRQRLNLSTAAMFDELLARIRGLSSKGQMADDVCLVGVDVLGPNSAPTS